MPPQPYRLLTIDLDDTLWPCAPVIRAAEEALHAWLGRVAPRLTERHDIEDLRRQRRALMARRPDLAHDLSAVRREALAEQLLAHGYPAALADEGLALFRAERNRVTPYPDVLPALRALAGRVRLVSITNGNAEVAHSPLRGLFERSLTAAEAGAARPDPALFRLALDWAGVAPGQCLHLGDDPYLDVEAARACGLAAIWVNRTGRPWPAELAPPLAIVADLAALPRWFAGETHAL
ncbi:HAD family hydrolase [Thiococcus pfennigii]|uniref:HAD family hydrolase n=2 Tax=Thiococcus pfennigii TaxID=1057 RepID=UPI001905B0F6|nr:HAD family hydrolase [Thiococcus pfennigii]MBK1732355.1 haloacid dehalogenase [Thiococcus pfennigii]